MPESTVTAERGALVTVNGPVAAAVTTLRARIDAVAGEPGTGFVAVDLSAALSSDPELFVVLAEAEARLRARQSRLVVIGMHAELWQSLEECPLWAVFPLYRAARERTGATARDDPGRHVVSLVAPAPGSGGAAAAAVAG